MTQDFWNTIQPQLDEIIFNELSDSNPAYILIETLDKPFWWQDAPYSTMKVCDERNDLTLIAWINAAESMMGEKMADIFEDMLKSRIHSTIETQWEIRMKELGEAYTHEMKEVA